MNIVDMKMYSARIEYLIDKMDRAYLWCEQNLPDGSWWYVGNGRFEFDDDKNRVWFILSQT